MKKIILFSILLLQISCKSISQNPSAKAENKDQRTDKVIKTEAEWKKILTPLQFTVTRKGGTEQAFTGKDWDNHEVGTYHCSCCDLQLFDSETKFESGTGWPSFFQPIVKNAVDEYTDSSYGMKRTEVKCARCDAHLGHVFEDGPKPTGLRYCMNSISLSFVKKP